MEGRRQVMASLRAGNRFVAFSTVVVGVLSLFLIQSLTDSYYEGPQTKVVNFVQVLVAYSIAYFYYYLVPRKLSSPSFDNDNGNGYTLLPSADYQMVDMSSRPTMHQVTVENIAWSNTLTFMLNGTPISLVNPDPAQLLVSFIRDTAGLKGTKLGCEEGGCGCCSVILTTSKAGIISVNSCLRPLCAMDGQAVNTVESIGSVSAGLSDEQTQIVQNSGTQCGFCTPGWVSNMHALNEATDANGEVATGRQIENYLDGNMCRCTGYRPIVKAFKTFSAESCHSKPGVECAGVCASVNNCQGGGCATDLEAICGNNSRKAPGSSSCEGKKSTPLGRKRDEAYVRDYVAQPLMFYNPVTKQRWVRPVSIEQLVAVVRAYGPTETIQFMGGNTGQGVNKYFNDTAPYNSPDQYSVIVDINAVPVFALNKFDPITGELTIGAGVTINSLISSLQAHAKPASFLAKETVPSTTSLHNESVEHSSLFSVCAHHLTFIAGTQVRNAGTWAGNLMTFLRHQSFPSDCVLALTTVAAKLHIMDSSGGMFVLSMDDFIRSSYQDFASKGYVILSATLTESRVLTLGYRTVAETFRIAQRNKNSHAHVNAGFHFRVSGSGERTQGPVTCTSARIVFGGVSQRTFIATRTEQSLLNMPLTAATLQSSLDALMADLYDVGASEFWGDQQFRESVMQTYLYRFFLRCYPVHALPSNVASAVFPWVKPESRGVEVFTESGAGKNSDVKEGPVGKAVKKLEAPLQTTGEATYPSDTVLSTQGLHAALVFSTQCAVTLLSFDISKAQAISGFVRFISAADIPGTNAVADGITLFVEANTVVQCVGAPLGVVVATSEAVANTCAGAIVVNYSGRVSVPITNVDEAVAQESFFPLDMPGVTMVTQGTPKEAMESSYKR
jgi:xanthine dehydrogenase/oxidase